MGPLYLYAGLLSSTRSFLGCISASWWDLENIYLCKGLCKMLLLIAVAQQAMHHCVMPPSGSTTGKCSSGDSGMWSLSQEHEPAVWGLQCSITNSAVVHAAVKKWCLSLDVINSQCLWLHWRNCSACCHVKSLISLSWLVPHLLSAHNRTQYSRAQLSFNTIHEGSVSFTVSTYLWLLLELPCMFW